MYLCILERHAESLYSIESAVLYPTYYEHRFSIRDRIDEDEG